MTATRPLVTELRAVAAARILFGHQSVGRDVLDGTARLALEHGVSLHIRDAREDVAGAPGLFHTVIGTNRDPASKCREFADWLLGAEQARFDAALMKFCYADLDHNTPLGPPDLIELYTALVAEIGARRPELPLIHVTMPLCAVPRGRRYLLRRVLALPIAEHADNVLRNAYNDALRARYRNAPIFDLERVECAGPGDNIVVYRRVRLRTLAAAYTTDGGHLNDAGKRAAATELIRTLARTLRAPTPAAPFNPSVR